MFTLLLVVIGIALLFDLVNGFHDAANSIATVVSTKVLTPFQAVIWAAFFNVLAFWVFDMSVGNTVAKTVDNTAIDLWVILAGLLAATTWNLLTWWLGIPSSSSHTLIGGFAGAAITHVAIAEGSLWEGFGVIAGKEILTVVFFIFLAPIIGGIISYLITVVTIARNFWYKMLVILLLSVITIFAMLYMIEYLDVKPIMLYIVAGIIAVFIFVYTYQHLMFRNRPSALREAGMHKKLQLLSSAAFSLGHGGADSQKVMGIICAALLVYGNTCREQGRDNLIGEQFAITELIQVEYRNADGKLEKFKPEYAIVDSNLYYLNHKEIVDSKGRVLYDKKGELAGKQLSNIPSFKAIDTALTKLEVYLQGKALCDAKTKDTIFNDKTLNAKYVNAGIFNSVVNPNGELKSGYKLKTKVHAETMPFWISFGCYLMIGLGTLMGGWKIVKTMGSRITKVTPLEGVCAETAGALTLFTVSNFGIPVSTTHTITGSIIGVGATRRLSAVRWGVTINLLWAWILTIPVSGLLAGLIYCVVYFL
ncbi:MAG: inorganic phosphate transporter [Bacteroidetes bacterium]|nr:inorganic phosphate transporter [Bacteroidota bacterium]MBM3424761.1 inorganic phosphate transporter [Bacteroidota bacterium]